MRMITKTLTLFEYLKVYNNSMRIILASGSPRRHYLLKMINLPHDVLPSDVEEDVPAGVAPEQVAGQLALLKADYVAQRHPGCLVIGADTMVVLGDEILGKPIDARDAAQTLHKLSGKTHTVITGVALVHYTTDGIRQDVFHETTRVTFANLTNEEIQAYIAGGSPMDKAGAYGIQDDLGALFVSSIEGDYYNVVGLPVQRLYRRLLHMYPEATELLFTVPKV